MRADKAKVVDEIWDDARINSFLDKQPFGPEDADFSKLLHAYRSMRIDDFRIFLQRFVDAGGNVNASDQQGQTLSDIVAKHGKSSDFLNVLAAAD